MIKETNLKQTKWLRKPVEHKGNMTFLFVLCVNVRKVTFSSSHHTFRMFSALHWKWRAMFKSHVSCMWLFILKVCLHALCRKSVKRFLQYIDFFLAFPSWFFMGNMKKQHVNGNTLNEGKNRKQTQKHSLLYLLFPGAFDPNIPEEGPSAPPPGWLDDVHGYQGHKGGGESFILLSSLLFYLSLIFPNLHLLHVFVYFQRMITRCIHLPLPIAPSLNSTGTPWCPMSGNTQ